MEAIFTPGTKSFSVNPLDWQQTMQAFTSTLLLISSSSTAEG
jgi:hypothetical protein